LEVAVQGRDLAELRLIGEQVGAHPFLVLGDPRVVRRARQTGADHRGGFLQVGAVGFKLNGQDSGDVPLLHEANGKHRGELDGDWRRRRWTDGTSEGRHSSAGGPALSRAATIGCVYT